MVIVATRPSADEAMIRTSVVPKSPSLKFTIGTAQRLPPMLAGPGIGGIHDGQRRALDARPRFPSGAESTGSAQETDQLWSAWMAAAQAGDRSAYEALLRACTPFIKRVARHQGVHPDWIDDVVQETLLAIHGARRTYDPGRSFTAWLRTIAQRRAIDGSARLVVPQPAKFMPRSPTKIIPT